MIVLESGFGNDKEAFIENRYSLGVNVIYSDDNNKGKTLLLQGLMYSIGNDPIFPEGFDYKNYYFYSFIEVNNSIWRFLRKGNNFVILNGEDLRIIESVSELKRYIHTNIFELPTYEKDGQRKLAELALLYQIFFLPQDNRDTSNVFGGGYFNKADFYEMLYSFTGETPVSVLSNEEVISLLAEIKQIKDEIRDQTKMLRFAKKRPEISAIANSRADKELFNAKKSRLEKFHTRISENKKKRAREASQKIKLERLIDELRSLNRTINTGRVECGDCHSQNILFKSADFAFEVSNDYVRKNILSSINSEISLKQEIMDEISRDIDQDQKLLTRELEDTPKSIQTLMFAFEEILSDTNIQNNIQKLEELLTEKQSTIEKSSAQAKTNKISAKSLIERVVSSMQSIYNDLDPNGKLEFRDIFSKRGVVYSGSEGMEFYFAKLISMKHDLNHQFPIIIDSFRDGELSTEKERIALSILKEASHQSIVTSTVKAEEYLSQIYKNDGEINAIDYSSMKSSKILTTEHLVRFKSVLGSFLIKQ